MPGYRPSRSVFFNCSAWVNLGSCCFTWPISLISSVITGIPLLVSVGIFSSLLLFRQRTDKEAVAAGLFAVLSRKRVGFRPGSRRTGPGLVVHGAVQRFSTPALLQFLLPYLSGNDKQGVC